MNPPIKVEVSTDNLRKCTLKISGAEGEAGARVIEVPSDGNVYQGLHAVRSELELAFNQLLEAHGITPPPPPSDPVAKLEAQKARVAELEAKKAEKDAAEAREKELEELKAKEHELLEELGDEVTKS